ncbi:hypothetical protein QJS10_CPA07g01184 [Acorus calamus]|uniref:Myb/SANT-like domain-containing protein n=1 Tax=Acorus calamus TaxID=4465 RepID=A0AAV9EJF0_ACOCL|nr:hypothetical protein QJS10_CPA07g01184 [Acorus calamus]
MGRLRGRGFGGDEEVEERRAVAVREAEKGALQEEAEATLVFFSTRREEEEIVGSRDRWCTAERLDGGGIVEQCLKGRRIDGGFTSTGWAEVVTAFHTRFPHLGLNKDKLRGRLRTLKKKYSAVKDMMEQSGFGWNPNTNTIEVDISVWESYLELQQIFGDTVAHGGGSRTINQLDTSTPVEVTNLDETQSPMHQFDFGDDDMVESPPKPPQTSDSRRRKFQSEENSGRNPKSRRSATDGFLDAVNNLASVISKRDEKKELIFKQCIEALDDIPTLSKDEYLAANDMFADSKTARSFINCKREYRIDWIKRKMMSLD